MHCFLLTFGPIRRSKYWPSRFCDWRGCGLTRAGCTQRTVQNSGMTILPLDGSPGRRVALREGASVHGPRWSNDGKKIAFARDLDDRVELWIADAATGQAKPIAGARLNDVLVRGITWLGDNRHLLAALVPEGRGPAPQEPRVPIGPNVQESSGRLSQMATFQDLLTNPHEEDLFAHFATSQLARIDTETGQIERIGSPGLFTDADYSPDEKYLLVQTIRRPFSYRVPYDYFTRKTEVWDANAQRVVTVADLAISDDIPRQGVPTGPRAVRWQPLYEARLIWTEALDGGEPRKKVGTSRPRHGAGKPLSQVGLPEVMETQHRFGGFEWLAQKDQALATETDRDRRWRTTALVDLTKPDDVAQGALRPEYAGRLQQSRRADDRHPAGRGYNRSCKMVTRSIWRGRGLRQRDRGRFSDKMDLKTGEKKRLFQCADGAFESVVAFAGRFAYEYPHPALRRRRSRPITSSSTWSQENERSSLTSATLRPELTGIKKELIKYQREDGVRLSGTLYLPPDYKEGTRLPLIVWAYPMEYSDAGTAGQVRTFAGHVHAVGGAVAVVFRHAGLCGAR